MKHINILLIEDELLLRSLFKDTLALPSEYKDVDFRIDTAADFKEALVKLENGPVPDVIILDLRLPSGDPNAKQTPEKEYGFEILKRIVSDKKFTFTPVIVFTNLADRESEQMAYRLGAGEFIVKSRSLPTELFDRIVKVCQECAKLKVNKNASNKTP